MIDQSSVLSQIDVAVRLRGGTHMMPWSRQAQGRNVIRECSCVSALLNTLLNCFFFRGEDETAMSLCSLQTD